RAAAPDRRWSSGDRAMRTDRTREGSLELPPPPDSGGSRTTTNIFILALALPPFVSRKESPTMGALFGAVLALALGASVASPAAAEQGGATPLRSTVAQIAARVAADLAPTIKDPVVFVAPLRSDEPVTRGNELAGRLVTLVAGAFGPGASASAEPVTLATAQTLARKA